MADEGYKPRSADDSFQAFLPHLFRWLVLVAAIAVGVLLGMYIFFKIATAEMEDHMKSVWNPTSFPTFPTYTTPSYAP
jgi:hypothetical protein